VLYQLWLIGVATRLLKVLIRRMVHPICLCLTMIVYVVHINIWCCRWIWWGLELKRG